MVDNCADVVCFARSSWSEYARDLCVALIVTKAELVSSRVPHLFTMY